MLLAATLACNISSPQQESSDSVPGVAVTETQPVDASAESNNAEIAPTADSSSTNSAETENPGDSSSSETGGSDLSITESNDIRTSISIKNGNETYEGNVSFPGNNTSDTITIKPVDFDDTKTSGQLVFSLACSGQGKAKVNYKGGAVRSGAPGCGETWTVQVVNGSPDSHISIRLDANGDVNWSLSVVSGE